MLKKGTGGWRKVVAAFGNEILLDNGEVDRAKLGQIVFSDSDKRQLLNRYIHIFLFLLNFKQWCNVVEKKKLEKVYVFIGKLPY